MEDKNQEKHKLLFAHCKRCNNGQLEVFFTHHSIGTFCPICKLVVFEIADFERFLKEVSTVKCEHCGSGGETERKVN